ncbi:MAG: hypothetical protein JRC87_04225 [Deltaproteobacteria bacterium]|nr:hypothetical protein [Deltaproteobacteria bacterium]MBW2658795.1 hypothetical protein [Deltaproteobacteria bacterium]
MKRFAAIFVFLVMGALVVGYAGIATSAEAKDYKVSAAGPTKLDKKGTVEISGSGFEPGSVVILLFNSTDGIRSDLSGSVKPAPVADATGAWKTTWAYGRLVKKKIIKEGSYRIDVANQDYENLADTTVNFVK